MLEIEDILCELKREDEDGLPPGFRFHPTDEELITFYLASKVFHGSSSSSSTAALHIAEVDLNRCEPWELPDVAKMGEREWYLYSMRDRKYPTGLRTNRATGAGYWKATGKDREVYSGTTGCLLGMKKTLVFYRGRAPRGEKTKWVMHEYRLDGHLSARQTLKEEWVICRIYHRAAGLKKDGRMGQSYPTLKTLMTSSANVTFLHTHHQKETTSSFAFHHYLPQPQENAINGVLASSFPTTSDKTDFYLSCSNNNTIPCIFKSLISPNENDKNNTSIFYGMSSSSSASQMVGASLQESWPPMDHLLQVDIPPRI